MNYRDALLAEVAQLKNRTLLYCEKRNEIITLSSFGKLTKLNFDLQELQTLDLQRCIQIRPFNEEHFFVMYDVLLGAGTPDLSYICQ